MSERNWLLSTGWFLVFLLAPFGDTALGLLAVLVGLAWNLARGKWRPRLDDATYQLFIALLGIMVVSGLLSPVKHVAVPLTVGYALLVFGFVFGTQWVAVERRFLMARLLPALVMGSLGSSLYAIGYYFVAQPGRTASLFTGFNGLGTLIVLAGGVSLGFLAGLAGKWRLLVLPYLGIVTTALFLTFSRGAWLGFLGMLAAFALVNRSSRPWAASGLAAVTLALSIVPAFSARFSSSFRLAENLNRLYIWRSTLNMIKDHPWFGVGAGVFMHVYPKYVLPGAPEPVVAYAHNLFLQVLAEFGLVGFLVFVAILGRVMWMSWQLARTGDVLYQGIFAALIGVLIHQQVDIPIWGLEVGGAFWVVVGLVVTLYRNELGAAGRTPSETMLGG